MRLAIFLCCALASLLNYEILETIGEGCFGRVHLARETSTRRLLALKAINKGAMRRGNMERLVRNEINIMRSISSPFIVEFHETFQSDSFVFIAMEYCPLGELFYQMSDRKLSLKAIKFYAAQIVLMLEHLHSHKIVHGDIKPENIYIASDGYLKLGDFGCAQLEHDKQTLCGSLQYSAPEVSALKRTVLSDWWSFGVVVYAMISQSLPFEYPRDGQMQKRIEQRQYIFSDAFDRESMGFVYWLLQDPQKRLGKNGAQEVKAHSWFKEIDFDAIERKKIIPPQIFSVSKEDLPNPPYFEKNCRPFPTE